MEENKELEVIDVVENNEEVKEAKYTVKLVDAGKDNVSVIKTIQIITDLSLIDAKRLVDEVPSVVKEHITLAEAEDIQNKLNEVGADVEFDEETEGVEVVDAKIPEEVEVIEYEVDVTIEKETYVEYFKNVSFKSQLKPSLFFGLLVVLLSYFFRAEETTATDALLQGLLWGVILVVVSLAFTYFFTPSRAAKTYDRSGISGMVLKTTFSDLGIRQTIEDQSVLYRWSSISYFIESETSLYGHMPSERRVLLMSKKTLTEEDIAKIQEIIKEHIGEENLKPMKK